MALKATIFKIDLQISDMDRNYYAQHALTIARHPSETDERMWVRILAFALHAQENLTFGKGLCADGEPDLWQKDLTGAVEHWIDVGLPDEKRTRKACNRSKHVTLLAYGGRSADRWWDQYGNMLQRFDNLTVLNLPETSGTPLNQLASSDRRSASLQCLIQDGQIWLSNDSHRLDIPIQRLKSAAPTH